MSRMKELILIDFLILDIEHKRTSLSFDDLTKENPSFGISNKKCNKNYYTKNRF